MRVQDIMSRDPVVCRPDTGLGDVARLMTDYDCGEIPVCDAGQKPIGVVTDRDIVCRIVASGRNPLDCRAADCMSEPVVTASLELELEDCVRLMEQHRVRRLPVVDELGVCCGIVAQADLARRASRDLSAEVVAGVSERSGDAGGPAPSRA